LSEDSVFSELFTEGYFDLAGAAKKRFSDFKINHVFHDHMKEIKKDPNLARNRLINPQNPNGQSQTFYSKGAIDALAKHYTAR